MEPLPFPVLPAAEAWYPASANESAREALFHCLDRGEGIAVVFGGNGLGKTLLLRVLAQEFNLSGIAIISNTKIKTIKTFYQQILLQLHQSWCGCDENELRLLTVDYLQKISDQRIFLLLDDAQSIPFPVLDEIRSLMDIGSRRYEGVRVVLAGTSRLEERLNGVKFVPLNQRIACRVWLEPFPSDETAVYLDTTLENTESVYADFRFTPAAKRLVHRLTEGVPRLVNQLCNQTLFMARELAQKGSDQNRLNPREDYEISDQTVARCWSLLQQIPEGTVPGIRPLDHSVTSDLNNTPLTVAVENDESIVSPSYPTEPEQNDVVEFGSLPEDDEEDEDYKSEIPPCVYSREPEETTGAEFKTESNGDNDNSYRNTSDCTGDTEKSSDADDCSSHVDLSNTAATDLLRQKTVLPAVSSEMQNVSETSEITEIETESVEPERQELECLNERHNLEAPLSSSSEASEDLTNDRLIRIKVLGDSIDENDSSDENLSDDFCESALDALVEESRFRIDDNHDTDLNSDTIQLLDEHYLRELRQLEGEISIEAEVIRQLRDIHLHLRQSHSTAYRRVADSEELSVASETVKKSTQSGQFQSVFQQIYSKNNENEQN